MKLASKNLTPLTLELLNKSCNHFQKCEFRNYCQKNCLGQIFNSGQSCMAPNHIFAEKEIVKDLIEKLKQCIEIFYGQTNYFRKLI